MQTCPFALSIACPVVCGLSPSAALPFIGVNGQVCTNLRCHPPMERAPSCQSPREQRWLPTACLLTLSAEAQVSRAAGLWFKAPRKHCGFKVELGIKEAARSWGGSTWDWGPQGWAEPGAGGWEWVGAGGGFTCAERAQKYAFVCGVGPGVSCVSEPPNIAGTELLNSLDLRHWQAEPCLGLTQHDPAEAALLL